MIKILLACAGITIFPWVVGRPLAPSRERGGRLLFSWIYGQLVLWAAFLVLSVPMILIGKNYAQVRTAYAYVCVALFVIACGATLFPWLRRRKTGEGAGADGKMEPWLGKKRWTQALWVAFACILLVQVLCALFLAYEDGDDAYYVAITTYCQGEKPLYRIIPYTGFTTELQARHALAPFPVWVAILAEASGLSGAATSHVMMPLLVLLMTYGLYALIGRRLFQTQTEQGKGWTLPLFLCFVALLIMFGGYSIYSPENFLVVRAAQGKAVLANVVIPALVYAMMLLLEALENQEKVPSRLWVVLFAIMTTGCLCSSLGGFLLCIFLGLTVFCACICYHRWKLMVGAFVTMLVPMVVAALYSIL